MLERGVLEKRWSQASPSCYRASSAGFKFLQRAKLANLKASRVEDRIVTEDALLANDGRYRRPAIAPDAIAVLQYTGGTTGTPKGAMLTRQPYRQCRPGDPLAKSPTIEHDRVLGVLSSTSSP